MNERGIDPIRFGDLTYPQVVCILTDGKSGESEGKADFARKLLADVKAGKYAAAAGTPATFKANP